MSNLTPQRILHVIPYGGMGGAGQIVIDLVQHQLADPRFDPCVAVLTNGDFGGALPSDRVFELGASLERGASLTRLRRFRELVGRLGPQLIHSHLWPASSCVQAATTGMNRLHHVVHIHDAQPSLTGNDMRTRIRKGLLRLPLMLGSPSYIAVAESVRKFSMRELGIPSRSIRTILNGTDVAGVSLLPTLPAASPFTIGAAGRFAAEKGYRYLIEAVHQLTVNGRDVRLLLAGDGGLRADYQSRIAELDIEQNVEFLGDVSSMGDFYRGLNACVFPSILPEGLPLVVLEAMAAGVPIIATTCGGTGEAISDGITGLVVEPRDAGGIASAVEWLMDDADRGERLRVCAREDIERRFDKQRMCREVDEVYCAELSLLAIAPSSAAEVPKQANPPSLVR